MIIIDRGFSCWRLVCLGVWDGYEALWYRSQRAAALINSNDGCAGGVLELAGWIPRRACVFEGLKNAVSHMPGTLKTPPVHIHS